MVNNKIITITKKYKADISDKNNTKHCQVYVFQSQGSNHSPDWLMKNATSSLKIGVLRSRKSDDNSTITGSSVSSSTN